MNILDKPIIYINQIYSKLNLEEQQFIFEIVSDLRKTRIGRKLLFNNPELSLLKLAELYVEELEKHRSSYIFNNNIVIVYPHIRLCKAKNRLICDFSGAVISKGSEYGVYRLLLENLTTNETYVLQKSIRFEIGYEQSCPQNIGQFDCFEYGLNHLSEWSDDIDYVMFSQNYGRESLTLQRLQNGDQKQKFYNFNIS